MSEIVIEAHGLTKRYGKRAVVDSIDLTVSEGEVLGLLGPNGAGKTTTILMLLGLTEPSAGTVSILGKDPLREPLSVKRDVASPPVHDSASAMCQPRASSICPSTASMRAPSRLKMSSPITGSN